MIADQVELIIAALVTGAAAGTSATAEQVLKDSYAGLKGKLAKFLKNRGMDHRVLDAIESGDESAQDQLRAELEGSAVDADVVEAARKLYALLETTSGIAKYQSWIHDNQGVVIGDSAHVTMRFDSREDSD